ncbi:PAS domain S-box protein [Fodinibius sp. Rm-B-1B1-1]|uniref:PAS domain S-box protein n=1 Tax=Fodinibius alkaliphilus TaxID=3140241 RepID=UPI00315A59F9
MSNDDQYISLSPLKITAIYLIIAILWIAFTDRLLGSFVSDTSTLSTLQTYKGWFYVLITSLGLYYLIKRNVDQIKEKEKQLRSSVQNLKSEKELTEILFERIPILITIYDPDLEKFEVNREFEKVTGWTNEEIENEEVDLMEACYPDLEIREETVEFMNNPGLGWKEFPLRTKSGEPIPTSWTNIKLTDNTSVGIGIDMSEIKASQAKVRKSRELLKKTFESLQSSIIVLDMETRTIVECNKGTEEMFGYSRDELIGSSTRKLYESAAKFMLFDERSKKKLLREGIFETEFTMQRKDGSIFYTDHTVSLVRDEDDNIEKVVSVIRNINEQKKYQRQLEQHNEFIKTTFNNLPIGVIVTNIDTGEVTLMNEPYSDIHGWPEETLKDEQAFYHNAFPDQEYREKVRTQIQQDINSHNPDRMQWDGLKIQTQEKEQRIVNVKNIPLYDQNLMISTVEDVTQRKTLENQLLLQNKKLERTQKVAGIGYWEYELQSKELFWSENLKHIYGLSAEYKPDIDTFLNMVPPEDQPNFDHFVRRVIDEEIIHDMFRLIKPNGEEGFYHSRNELIKDNEERPKKILGIVHEITDLKQAEKELSKEKQRFELVAQTTSDVIWDLDFKKNELWWSKGFEDTFGYQRHSLKTNYEIWEKYIHPDDREKVSESSKKALESDAQEWEEEYRLIKADGTIAHLIDRAIIIRDEKGAPLRMIGTMDDITERKKAEKQLRESEEKYRHLFEDNPEPMWIYDPKTLQLIEVNHAAIEHYGYSEEEFLNMTLLDIRPHEDAEALKQNVKKNAGTKSYSEEWVHIKKDGTEIIVEISAADVRYKEDKKYRLVLINDVTEQKRMQEKIIQSVIEGENRERKRIAHELHDGLGQYLVAANMNLQSVQNNADPLPEKRRNQLETGVSLLKNALSETRSIAHNLMPKVIADYGLIAAIDNQVKDLQKSSDVTIQFEHNCAELDLKKQVEINIYRIVQEILSNAIRHANCTTIDIELQLKKDTLTLVVQDDGIGTNIEENHQDKGLGLQSIKTRVSNLRGSLDIDSEHGMGMVITVTIPNIDNLKSGSSNNG